MQVSPTGSASTYYSKRYDSLEEAKRWASMRKENTKSYNYDYIILESTEYIEVPVPKFTWKKVK